MPFGVKKNRTFIHGHRSNIVFKIRNPKIPNHQVFFQLKPDFFSKISTPISERIKTTLKHRKRTRMLSPYTIKVFFFVIFFFFKTIRNSLFATLFVHSFMKLVFVCCCFFVAANLKCKCAHHLSIINKCIYIISDKLKLIFECNF